MSQKIETCYFILFEKLLKRYIVLENVQMKNCKNFHFILNSPIVNLFEKLSNSWKRNMKTFYGQRIENKRLD